MRRFAGWFLVCCGLLFFGLEIDQLLSGTAEHTVFGMVLGGIFVFAGSALIRGARRAAPPAGPVRAAAVAQPRALSSRDHEQAVLECALRRGGRVTIAEVAADTELSFTEAKAVLEELSRAGACTVDVTEAGAFIYEFAGLLPREPARQRDNA